MCCEAAMKIKIKSGIQRFQKEKKYGIWFGELIPFVSSMHSWQPQQEIEPSNIEQFEMTESTDEPSKHLLVLKTSSIRLQDMSWRRL